ncbi:MAG: hypothetical protein M1829_002275 [Trizodia sp. TS-e1964]|nr:MAG: hypothetical protein M1829_002275 [Trizodia sp. TS-e1964]
MSEIPTTEREELITLNQPTNTFLPTDISTPHSTTTTTTTTATTLTGPFLHPSIRNKRKEKKMHTSPRQAAHYRAVCILSTYALYGPPTTPRARSLLTAFVNWKFFTTYAAHDLLAAYARFLLTHDGLQMYREVQALRAEGGGGMEGEELRETRREVERRERAREREGEGKKGKEGKRVGPWGAGLVGGTGARRERKIWW